MFKYFLTTICLLLVVFFASAFAFAFPLYAQQNFTQGDNVILSKEQVINKDYFAAGENVTVSGTVNGDAYLAGGNILVEGTINGDLIAGGGTINVRGTVVGNVRAAGGNVLITGNVGRSATLMGGNIQTTDQANIGKNLVVAGGNVNVFSPVTQDITLAAGNVEIGNVVGGDITAGVGKLTLTPNAKINGTTNYWSQDQALIQPGATVSGQLNHYLPPEKERNMAKSDEEVAAGIAGMVVFFEIIGFLSSLVTGLLLIKFAPVYTLGSAETILNRVWASLGIGFLTLILVPILFVALLITLIGVPVALILMALFLILLYVANLVASLAIGKKILESINQNHNVYLQFVVGLVVISLAGIIPVLGGIFRFVLLMVGIGALVIYKKEVYQTLRAKKII